MNKIKCEIQDNIFENFPVGTIFSYSGDFYIKINHTYEEPCFKPIPCAFGTRNHYDGSFN